MDLPEARERWPALRKRAEEAGLVALAISSATQRGYKDLMNVHGGAAARDCAGGGRARGARGGAGRRRLAQCCARSRRTPCACRARARWLTACAGKRVERMVAMTNPDSTEGMERLETQLRKMGVLKALEEAGVQPGDMVHFGKIELVWGDEMF